LKKARERIRKTQEGNFDPAYKESEIAAQEKHIAQLQVSNWGWKNTNRKAPPNAEDAKGEAFVLRNF
jgi:predicted outer membrane protein